MSWASERRRPPATRIGDSGGCTRQPSPSRTSTIIKRPPSRQGRRRCSVVPPCFSAGPCPTPSHCALTGAPGADYSTAFRVQSSKLMIVTLKSALSTLNRQCSPARRSHRRVRRWCSLAPPGCSLTRAPTTPAYGRCSLPVYHRMRGVGIRLAVEMRSRLGRGGLAGVTLFHRGVGAAGALWDADAPPYLGSFHC